MSRKLIITLAAAATVAVTSFASTTSYARSSSGFARGGSLRLAHTSASHAGRIHLSVKPRRPGRPGIPIIVGKHHPHHHHMHWVFRGGHWLEIADVVDDAAAVPAPVSVPGPCTCLSKTYTPAGLVVFADVCTKESASAPTTGDLSDASQAPTTQIPAKATPIAQVPMTPNYAGRTYQEYLAANPQMPPQASNQPSQNEPAQQN